MTAGRKCWCGRGVAADYPVAVECEEHDLPPATPFCPRTGIPTASCAHCRTRAREVWTQRYTASIRRRDGHTIDGIPGDCFRTALAYLLAAQPADVPHFALYLNWWEEIRRWLRDHDGRDLYYVDRAHPEHWEYVVGGVTDDGLVLIGGPSPRGPFRHVCVGRRDGSLVWDPHPSRTGLTEVDEFYVLGRPYYLLKPRLVLEAAS